MRVCLLTYDVAHKKTAEVFFGLHNRSEFAIEFLLVPFSRRPDRPVAIKHRPDQFEGVGGRALAQRFGLTVHEYERRQEALGADWLIVCGANLLEPAFASSGKIVNAHAGLIPLVRGLDSFKWAIWNLRPVGNTLHIIDEEADSGTILHQIETPVFADDDILTFAERHYRSEIWLLQNFDRFLGDGKAMSLEKLEPTKRMPAEIERGLADRFEQYKARFGTDGDIGAGRVATPAR